MFAIPVINKYGKCSKRIFFIVRALIVMKSKVYQYILFKKIENKIYNKFKNIDDEEEEEDG